MADNKAVSMKELTAMVVSMGENGGGTIDVAGTWRNKPRTIRVQQTEWCDSPVCLIGGHGQEIAALHPGDVPSVLDCVIGNYLDGDFVSVQEI